MGTYSRLFGRFLVCLSMCALVSCATIKEHTSSPIAPVQVLECQDHMLVIRAQVLDCEEACRWREIRVAVVEVLVNRTRGDVPETLIVTYGLEDPAPPAGNCILALDKRLWKDDPRNRWNVAYY